MSWGGSRVGAGKKPKGERPLRVRGPRPALVPMDGGRADDDAPVSSLPPEDLPADERAFWQRNAPRAMAQLTLTERTVEAFRMLCELDAERRATKLTIDREGRTFLKVTVDGAGVEHQELKAHPMVGRYDRLSKQVENLMGRFKLAPFGKAELPHKTKPAANPWATTVAPQQATGK